MTGGGHTGLLARIPDGTAAPPGPPSSGEARAFTLAQLLPRVLRADARLPFPVPRYAADLGGGLRVVAAVDKEEVVETLFRDDALAAHGSWRTLFPAALANLRSLPPPLHEVAANLPPTAPEAFHLFTADDYFGASRIVIVGELLARVGCPERGTGVVVAVPARDLLIAHVPSGEGTAQAVRAMAGFAARWFHADASGVSPWLYYRQAPGHPFEQISAVRDGRLTLRPTPAFTGVFARCARGAR
jgi:hypothetical protein